MSTISEDKDIYNIVTIKNIDDEDFVFSVDKEQYLVRAGEVRRFTKFMAKLAVKHLIDRILIKESSDGALLSDTGKREALSMLIVLEEENFQKPMIPTDREIVEDLNRVSDIDKALNKRKSGHEVTSEKEAAMEKEDRHTLPPDPDDNPLKEEQEKFDQLEKEKADKTLPSRSEMISHARNVLKINPEDKIKIGSKMVTNQSLWDKMTDQALFEELQMGV